MSDYAKDPPKIVYLLPHQIKLNKRYNVRLFSGGTHEAEEQRIERLAASMEESGQLDDAILDPNMCLIAGHRRLRATILINQRRDANFESLFRLRCRIDNEGGDLRLKAIVSNLHRSDRSPMDLCFLIPVIRHEKGWEGPGGTAKVAHYLSMDKSTITIHEALMRLETETQNMLHDGIISLKTCEDLRKAVPSPTERVAVLARAAAIQEEDRLDKAITDFQTGRKSKFETTRSVQAVPRLRIQHPAVMKAIRERNGTSAHIVPLNRQELVKSIAQLDAAGYSAELREFARYWAQKYALGHGRLEHLLALAKAIL